MGMVSNYTNISAQRKRCISVLTAQPSLYCVVFVLGSYKTHTGQSASSLWGLIVGISNEISAYNYFH